MGKRGSQSAAKGATKKPKVDPAMAAIADTLKKTSNLPVQCSTMLASMLPFSLAVAADERAECQQRVVAMVEETLNSIKTEAEATIGAEETKVGNLNATLTELLSTVQQVEATLAGRTEALEAANASLADVTATANTSSQTLAEQTSEHTECESKLASVQENKSALEEAFKTHFQIPMEAGEGPHFKELQPFLQTLDLEKSMLSTLPGICGKAKEDRGSFDQVVLEQLEKAIAAKIVTLSEAIAADTAALAERAAAVKAAETDNNSKKEAQNQSTAAFDTAQKDHCDANAALIKANEAVNEFRPQLEGAAEARESAKAKLVGFESGPLANFVKFNTRMVHIEAAPAEAAPAGA